MLAGVVARCRTSQHRCEVQRVVSHRSTVARSNALPAIEAMLQGLTRCWPSQQRCEVQRAIVVAAAKLYTFDVSRTFVGHPSDVRRHLSDFRPTFVGRPSTSVGLPSNFRRTSVRWTSVQLSSDFRPLNFHPQTSIHGLSSIKLSSYVLRPASYVLPTSSLTSLLASSYCCPTPWGPAVFRPIVLSAWRIVVLRLATWRPTVLHPATWRPAILRSTHCGRASCGLVSCSLSYCILP